MLKTIKTEKNILHFYIVLDAYKHMYKIDSSFKIDAFESYINTINIRKKENENLIEEIKNINYLIEKEKTNNKELESKLKSQEYKVKDAELKLKHKDKCIEDLNREVRKKEAEIRRLHKIITQSKENRW